MSQTFHDYKHQYWGHAMGMIKATGETKKITTNVGIIDSPVYRCYIFGSFFKVGDVVIGVGQKTPEIWLEIDSVKRENDPLDMWWITYHQIPMVGQ